MGKADARGLEAEYGRVASVRVTMAFSTSSPVPHWAGGQSRPVNLVNAKNETRQKT